MAKEASDITLVSLSWVGFLRSAWPEEHLHWQLLCKCVDQAREHVVKASAAMDEIDADRDLSAEGRDRKKKKIAAEAIAGFSAIKFPRVRQACRRTSGCQMGREDRAWP